MRCSTSSILALVLGAGVSVVPVAIAKPQGVAITEDAGASYSVVSAPSANETPSLALSLPGSSDLVNTGAALGGVTKLLSSITGLLKRTTLPAKAVGDIVSVIVGLVNGILKSLGSITDLSELTNAMKSLLAQAISALEGLLEKRVLDTTLNAGLARIISTFMTLLTVFVHRWSGILGNLLSLNFIGVVSYLLSYLLSILTTLLSAL